jgi:hypothetical protein
VIPTGIELFASNATFLCFLALEQIQREPSQGGQIFGGVSGASTALIFAKADIHDPVQFVFHRPMAAHRSCEFRPTAPGLFTNGEASIRFDGTKLVADSGSAIPPGIQTSSMRTAQQSHLYLNSFSKCAHFCLRTPSQKNVLNGSSWNEHLLESPKPSRKVLKRHFFGRCITAITW